MAGKTKSEYRIPDDEIIIYIEDIIDDVSKNGVKVRCLSDDEFFDFFDRSKKTHLTYAKMMVKKLRVPTCYVEDDINILNGFVRVFRKLVKSKEKKEFYDALRAYEKVWEKVQDS